MISRFNWGARASDLSERVLNLLENDEYLREERARTRKLTRVIQGFGSFQRPFSTDVSSFKDSSSSLYGRCNSHYSETTGFHNKKDVFTESNSLMKGDEDCYYSVEDHPFCEVGRPTSKTSLLPSSKSWKLERGPGGWGWAPGQEFLCAKWCKFDLTLEIGKVDAGSFGCSTEDGVSFVSKHR